MTISLKKCKIEIQGTCAQSGDVHLEGLKVYILKLAMHISVSESVKIKNSRENNV